MYSKKNVSWSVLYGIVTTHIALFFAYYFFSWSALIAAIILVPITAMGVTIGYHRLLTHSSFQTFAPIRWAFTLAGLTSFQGVPLEWVATHRKHHQFSDKDGDPHSPIHGRWHSHVTWLWEAKSSLKTGALYNRYAKDLYRERFMQFFSKWYVYLLWHAFIILVLFVIGFAIGGFKNGLAVAYYGFIVRLVWVWNFTWAVNSAAHIWGYRNFETRDRSKNNWWVALGTFGEGWHNNHHAHKTAANHGMKPWELDPSYWVIRVLSFIGCAWNIKKYSMGQHKLLTLHQRS